MVEVSRELNPERVCNSCLNRNTGAHEVKIGKNSAHMTVLSLCPRCLEDLYDGIAEFFMK